MKKYIYISFRKKNYLFLSSIFYDIYQTYLGYMTHKYSLYYYQSLQVYLINEIKFNKIIYIISYK